MAYTDLFLSTFCRLSLRRFSNKLSACQPPQSRKFSKQRRFFAHL